MKIFYLYFILFLTSFEIINGQTTIFTESIYGNGDDEIISSAIDNSGNVYYIGNYSSTTINFNNGISLNSSGGNEIFLAKYNSYGICQWAERIYGNNCFATDITIDNSGNIFICGFFTSSTINFNNGIFLNLYDSEDGFFAKYNNNGICQWAELVYGTDSQKINALDLSQNGDIIIIGSTESSTTYFNNSINVGSYGGSDVFVAFYNNLHICQWATNIGGNDDDNGNTIKVDYLGYIIIGGDYYSDPIYFPNSISLTNCCDLTVFYSKFDNSGNCLWAEKISGNGPATIVKLDIDGSNNIYLTGYYSASILYFNNSFSINNNQIIQSFLAKFNSNGVTQWAVPFSGDFIDYSSDISVDSDNRIFASGIQLSSNINFNNGKSLLNNLGANAFWIQYNTNGLCQRVFKAEGNNFNVGYSILSYNNIIYLSGSFESDTLFFNNNYSLINANSVDAFISKISLFNLPIVSTSHITNITASTAHGGGNVTNSGESPVTTRGICFSNNPNPTIVNNIVPSGSGLGSFISIMTNLNPNTIYYVRAFATNSYGTNYGNQITFSTIPTLGFWSFILLIASIIIFGIIYIYKIRSF